MPCLTPDCDRLIYSRGLCRSCYMSLYRQKKRESLNWRTLAAENRVLLKKPRRKNGAEKRIMELLASAGSKGMTRTQLNWYTKLTTEKLLDMARKMQIQIYRDGNKRTYFYPGMRPMSLGGAISFL